MDLTHLHLMLNHLPVLGTTFGFLILAWGVLRGYEEVKTVGLIILIFTAVAAVPVYLTGEPAEEVVEDLPGVSEQLIELHEDSALTSFVLAIASGVLALAVLTIRRIFSNATARILIFAVLLLSFVTGVFMARTANLGGQIRHSEIRQTTQNNDPATETKMTERGGDDDR